MRDYVFTSESVSVGHPDKVCDRVSDTLLDYFLERHDEARTAIECFATTNRLIIGGEYKSHFTPEPDELEDVARKTVRDIGYEQPGFNWKTMDVEILLHGQSPDIAQGVDEKADHPEGAGDQGIMFGYAIDETKNYMPAAIYYAHAILKHLEQRWRADPELGLGPDAKSQVTLRYRNGRPQGCEAVLVSIQHLNGMSIDVIRERVRESVIAVLPDNWMCNENRFFVNPTGRFVIGGPQGDAGLTGRKIVVDTYGGAAPHGGGAFSGKDPTKVDRSGAYAARYLAKNIVAAGLAKQCLIQLAYAIGIPQPLAIHLNCFGTAQPNVEDQLYHSLPDMLDLSPKGMRQHLKLNRPIYTPSSAYGHFGQEPTAAGAFSWEKLDLVPYLRDRIGNFTRSEDSPLNCGAVNS